MAEAHQELRAVFQANREFTRNLYTILAKNSGNVFFSPISIHAILSLSYQGAGGQTKEAFAKVLNLPDARIAAEGYKEVMSRLNSMEDVTLSIANKVFLQKGYTLRETFRTVAVKHFSSEVELLNFKQAETAASSINSWVERKTNNKIKNLITPDILTIDTALVLVNAIYFKGKWTQPFDVKQTIIEKFYLNDVDTVDVQMMHIKSNFYYKKDENLNAKVLELPYSNKNISLIVILPNERNGIGELERKLAQTDLTKITENMSRPQVVVGLPKFKIEQTIDLMNSLTKLGLGIIFDKNAQFPGIIEQTKNLFVDKVLQKSFIEVNEEGAEAAAATMIKKRIIKKCVPRNPPEEFVANKPFVIILITKENNENSLSEFNVLFYGKISEPPSVKKEA